MVTYEELDAHTFYYLVGLNSVTLPASRQGMFMRELDNRAVLGATFSMQIARFSRESRFFARKLG
jgi:hypothetical protein